MYPAYNQEDPDSPNCAEDSAYPAAPDSEYGWQSSPANGSTSPISAIMEFRRGSHAITTSLDPKVLGKAVAKRPRRRSAEKSLKPGMEEPSRFGATESRPASSYPSTTVPRQPHV